ncbi:MAG: hypothetical protein WC483_03605 [Candidatus Paceibacterota bacterium]
MKSLRRIVLAFLAILALASAVQTDIDEEIPPLACVYYGPFDASIYDMNYTITILPNDSTSALDILFVHNDSDPRTIFEECAVVSSDIFMDPSLVGAVDVASFLKATVTFDDAFWILLRNANPIDDNITIHAIGYVSLVESPLTTFTENWIYFVAALGALAALVLGAIAIKCGCSKCGQNKATKSIAMKSRV